MAIGEADGSMDKTSVEYRRRSCGTKLARVGARRQQRTKLGGDSQDLLEIRGTCSFGTH